MANLTSNTVSVLDLTSPASPRLIMNVPVGVQPTSMAVNPANPNLFYVANLRVRLFLFARFPERGHSVGRGQRVSTAAAGDLVLTIKDFERTVVRTASNGIPVSLPVTPPGAPSTEGLDITWYVDASAVAGGTGSSASPFRSISAAIEAATTGDVIFVGAGTYSPSATSETVPIGSPEVGVVGLRSGVTIIGAGAATTTIDGEGFIRSDGNALIIASDNVRLAGFTVRGAAQVGLFISGADNVTIEENLFTSNTRFGVGASGSRGLIIRNNVVVSNLEGGITVSGATSLALSSAPTNCPASTAGDYGAYIVNNTSNDNRADGILVSQGGNVCVADNVTNNNGSSGIEYNNRVEVSSVPALNGVMVNNNLSTNGGVQFGFAGTGILVTEDADVQLIQDNTLDRNGVGLEVAGASTAVSVINSTIDGNSIGGVFVRESSTLTAFTNNKVRNNQGQGGMLISASTASQIGSNEITNNGGPGISLFLAATATIENTTITDNAADGGIFLNDGSQATISRVLLRNNERQGILAAESGTIATLAGGNQIQNTRRDSQGDGGIGLNAQNSGRINCTGSNPLSGNVGGNTLESVTGCQ